MSDESTELYLPKPQIIISRTVFSDKSTIGELTIDGIFKVNTLEDTVRRIKLYGETAIPAGLYRTVLVHHPKFGFTAHLLNVPFFDGIYFHSGNHADDTLGCILVGLYDRQQANWIGQSRVTHKAMMDVLEPLNKREELWTQIIGGLTKDEMRLA